MTTNENNKIFFFYLHLEETATKFFRNSYIFKILEFKINAFWESSNWGPPQRRRLAKDRSDRFNKVLSTEFRSFKRDILALLYVTAWPNGYNSIFLKNRYYCIGYKYWIQSTAIIKYIQH